MESLLTHLLPTKAGQGTHVRFPSSSAPEVLLPGPILCFPAMAPGPNLVWLGSPPAAPHSSSRVSTILIKDKLSAPAALPPPTHTCQNPGPALNSPSGPAPRHPRNLVGRFLSIHFPKLKRSTAQGWAEARPHRAENPQQCCSKLPLPQAQRARGLGQAFLRSAAPLTPHPPHRPQCGFS